MACLLCVAPASAAVIDFEDLVVPLGFNTNADVTSGGFRFDTTLNHSHLYVGGDAGNVITENGTNFYATDDFVGDNTLTMSRVDGGTFAISRVDFAEFLQPDRVSSTVRVTGNLFGGGTVQKSVTLDQTRDGLGGVNDFQTETFTASWQNLTSVVFKGFGSQTGEDYFAIDNINTNPVPEPASMLLLIAAAGGLVACARAGRRRFGSV
jgi:hypothetical protein